MVQNPTPAGDDQAAESEDQATTSQTFTFEPTAGTGWVRPGYAAIVVSIVAVAILGVVGWSLFELAAVGANQDTADPNAGTIAAIASAGLSSLVSLASAYFGIKLASEQTTQANATAAMALEVASKASANSTTNGNPTTGDF